MRIRWMIGGLAVAGFAAGVHVDARFFSGW